MASEQEAYRQMMFWHDKSLVQLRAELVRVNGNHRNLCLEAASRLEVLQKFKEVEKRRKIVELSREQLEGLFYLATGRHPEPSERLVVAIEKDQQG